MAIVRYLLSQNGSQTPTALYVSKEDLYRLYGKNAFDAPERKLKIWRGLNWVDADPGRLTRRISADGHIQAMVKINRTVYETMIQVEEL
jgi:hypothetical protein